MSVNQNMTSPDEETFDFNVSEEQLLDEFGLLMAAEYYYAPTPSLAVVAQPIDPVTAFLRFGLPGVALRIPMTRTQKRFEVALQAQKTLFTNGAGTRKKS